MKERRLQKGEETKRKRAVYTYRIFENFKSRKKTESSNSENNNNKLTFFAAFTSNGEKREKHLNIKST